MKLRPPGRDRIPEVQRGGLSGPLQSATLRVFANSGLRWGFDACSTPNTSWAVQPDLQRRPRARHQARQLPSGTLTGWIQLDVTAAVTGNGTYSSPSSEPTGWRSHSPHASQAQTPHNSSSPPPAHPTPHPHPHSNLAVNDPTTTTLPLPGPPQPTTSPSPATTSSSTAATHRPTATNYSFTNLTCNTTYTLAIDAYDATGNTSTATTTSTATANCPDTTAPSTPAVTTLARPRPRSTELAASTDNGAYRGGLCTGRNSGRDDDRHELPLEASPVERATPCRSSFEQRRIAPPRPLRPLRQDLSAGHDGSNAAVEPQGHQPDLVEPPAHLGGVHRQRRSRRV